MAIVTTITMFKGTAVITVNESDRKTWEADGFTFAESKEAAREAINKAVAAKAKAEADTAKKAEDEAAAKAKAEAKAAKK